MSGLIFMVVLLVGFYFLIMRPQQNRVRQHNDLVASVGVGDEIVTAGGIVGVIREVQDRDVQLEIAPSVVIKLAKGAIAQKAPTVVEETE